MRVAASLFAASMLVTVAAAADLAEVAAGLKSKDAKVREKAAEQLGAAGKAALPFARQLCDATLDPNQQVGVAALKAVGQIEPRLAQPLTNFLIAPQPKGGKIQSTRNAAAEDIGQLGDLGLPAAGLLLHTLKLESAKGTKADETLMRTISLALARVGADDVETVKTFTTLATTKAAPADFRQLSLIYFNTLVLNKAERMPLAKAAFEALIADPVLAKQTLDRLATIGAPAEPLLPAIEQAQLSRNATVRNAAFEAHRRIQAAAKK